MASVSKSWEFVLSNEDGVPPSGKVTTEPGGEQARLGINSRAHPEAVERGFFMMPLEQALEFAYDIFKYDYWSQVMGYNIQSQLIASKVADLAFNASPKQAMLFVQRAINALRAKPIKMDGLCGADTLAAVNNTYLDGPEEARLYEAILAQATAFYRELRQKEPEKYSEALEAAWLKRLNKRPDTV